MSYTFSYYICIECIGKEKGKKGGKFLKLLKNLKGKREMLERHG